MISFRFSKYYANPLFGPSPSRPKRMKKLRFAGSHYAAEEDEDSRLDITLWLGGANDLKVNLPLHDASQGLSHG
ncbi:MAG: hypothetical protein HY053_07985 [Proteobacteria bacterium]|nr:hypothetical protein [Pseudomonadota bacterium]